MTSALIRPLFIEFTSDNTLIGLATSGPINNYIRIVCHNNSSGTNLQHWRLEYAQHGKTVTETITDYNILSMLGYGMNSLQSTLLEQCHTSFQSLSDQTLSAITLEYQDWIVDDINVLDCFIGSMAAYLGLCVLMERTNILPLSVSLPVTINSGAIFSSHIMNWFDVPLTALSQVTTGPILRLVLMVQSSLRLWSQVFTPGPVLNLQTQTQTSIDIISQLTQELTQRLAQAQENQELMMQQFQQQLSALTEQTQRELHNLRLETQQSVYAAARLLTDKIEQRQHHPETWSDSKSSDISYESLTHDSYWSERPSLLGGEPCERPSKQMCNSDQKHNLNQTRNLNQTHNLDQTFDSNQSVESYIPIKTRHGQPTTRLRY